MVFLFFPPNFLCFSYKIEAVFFIEIVNQLKSFSRIFRALSTSFINNITFIQMGLVIDLAEVGFVPSPRLGVCSAHRHYLHSVMNLDFFDYFCFSFLNLLSYFETKWCFLCFSLFNFCVFLNC